MIQFQSDNHAFEERARACVCLCPSAARSIRSMMSFRLAAPHGQAKVHKFNPRLLPSLCSIRSRPGPALCSFGSLSLPLMLCTLRRREVPLVRCNDERERRAGGIPHTAVVTFSTRTEQLHTHTSCNRGRLNWSPHDHTPSPSCGHFRKAPNLSRYLWATMTGYYHHRSSSCCR